MFVTSGASLHGHEYSNRPPPNTAARRIPLLRSALRSLSDAESNIQNKTSTHTATPPSARRLSYAESPCPPQGRIARPRPTSDYFPRKEQVVRFLEPESEPELEPEPEPEPEPMAVEEAKPFTVEVLPSEDEATYSEASDASMTPSVLEGRKRRRRTPRTGTKYLLAQPPPRVVKRHRRFIQIRPKLVLQLQELTETRPKPTYDVLPSSAVAGSVIAAPRLARRFPKFFHLGGGLGPSDLILARSEDYDAPTSNGAEEMEEDSLDKREFLAVISPMPHHADDKSEIVLGDGSIWVAGSMGSGSYEFVHQDAEGTVKTARWVRRKIPSGDPEDYKFTFSILDPRSRRHPIMATLTPSTLEILDNYTTVSPSCSRYPPTRSFSYDIKGHYPMSPETPAAQRTTIPVDEGTRTLITVSSVWISLHLNGIAAIPKPQPVSAPNRLSNNHKRAASVAVVERIPTCPCRTETPVPAQQASVPIRQISDPVQTVNDPAARVTAPPPRRTLSTGAAFMQRRRSAAIAVATVPAAPMASMESGIETGDETEKKGFYASLRRAFHKLGSKGNKTPL